MKIINQLAELKIFLGNGQSYFMEFRYPILLAIALKVYLPNANWIILGFLAILIISFLILLGWIDLKFIKLHQTQQEIQTGKYNPYFRKLKKSLNT